MKSPELNLKSAKSAVSRWLHTMRKYAGVIIFLLFTGTYGYLIYQINVLSNPSIDESLVLSESKTVPLPKLDEDAAKKLQSLEDNSVNVQTLFNQSRVDPFQ